MAALALCVSGCAGPGGLRTEAFRIPERVSVSEQGVFLSSTGSDQNLRAFGRWPHRTSNGSFQHGVVRMEPIDALNFRRLQRIQSPAPVQILAPEDYAGLRNRIGESLVPDQPGIGIKLLARGSSVILLRDEAGAIRVNRPSDLPPDAEIVGAYDLSTYIDQGIHATVDFLRERARGGDRLLLPLSEPNDSGLLYLYFDLSERQAMLLTLPANQESGLIGEIAATGMTGLGTLVFRSHVLTFIKNPVTSMSRLINYLATSAYVLATDRFTSSPSPPAIHADQPPMDLRAWERQLDEWNLPDALPGKVEWLIGGQAFFSSLHESVARASDRVRVRVYIIDNDDTALELIQLLSAKQRSGVDVRILFDELGSALAGNVEPETGTATVDARPASIYRYIKRNTNVDVRRTTNPWFTGDHVKTLLIDGRTAFVGGMNIGREYRYEWHDLMAKITGPVVEQLEADFDRAWSHAGLGGDIAYAFRPKHPHSVRRQPESDEVLIRPLYTRTFRKDILRTHIEAIRRSQSYIWLQNSYLGSTAIINELIAARARGVDVRVILPAENNHGVMGANNLVVANRLLEGGIRVYAYPGMSHVKAAIFDGWASIGSANYDKLSLYINQELNLAVSDPDAVQRLREDLFEKDFAQSREITETAQTSWSDHFYTILARQL